MIGVVTTGDAGDDDGTNNLQACFRCYESAARALVQFTSCGRSASPCSQGWSWTEDISARSRRFGHLFNLSDAAS